ncbi:nucleotide-binding protein [Thermodesulfovibrio yellowstonii]|uniref:ATP-binding protein n=1 Tax=Thermodesulfovibrio yellowstonii TaxID=28262 RepID=A0A9W6LLB6_9BACT|nr:P-loop NTPase [Thermodesulfovibrio islandicus]GLI53690.1 ATP-binding protein [Thermodesulfovibrio islandicus]
MRKAVVCGKGGVGKSFIVYGISKSMANKGKNVLVVDTDESNQTLYRLFGFSDPPESFMDFLGGKKAIQQNIKKRFQSSEKEPTMNVIEKSSFSVSHIPREFIKKDGNIALISIGKIKEPMEGCACPMGIISREFLEKIELKENEVIIVDTEAGVEHFGRGVEKGIDTVIAVAEPYLDSIEVAEKALSLAQKIGKRVYLVINKVQKEIEDKVKKTVSNKGLEISALIHFSPDIYSLSLEGRTPESSQVYVEIEKFVELLNAGL